MEGIKVREVSGEEEKSSQQIEQELLAKHDEKLGDTPESDNTVTVNVDGHTAEAPISVEAPETTPEVEGTTQGAEAEEKELEETEVLSFIKNRYNKDITSINELFEQTENNEDLPNEVTAFLEFKKETGRGLEDFMSLNKDYDTMSPDTLLAEYMAHTQPHLDEEDISFELNNKFSYDEDLADETEIKKINIAKKQELAKAKEYFNTQKKQYGVPLESSGSLVSEEEKEDYDAYKKHAQQSKDWQEHNTKRQEFFLKKTNDVFTDEFKGFDFKLGEKDVTYKPGNAEQLKKAQSDVTNFINMHVDEEGYLRDATAYHRSLAVAMNPESFAKFFYEQGKADAIGDVTRESKNVDMPVRKSPQSASKGGLQVRAIPTTHGSGLKIRSTKNN